MEQGKPFSTLHHLSLVVRDINAAVRFLESVGIGPFTEYPPMAEYTRLNVPDKDGFFDTRIRCAQIGPVQLQIVQPGKGRSIYKDFLEKNGEGVFHLGFVVPNIDAAEAEAKGMGLAVLSSGRRENGSGFSYFATADKCGVTLLARQSPPAQM
ncbi:MAG: Methylmalonyl-CoA epimerase [Deltaproteobacteria bacterium]|jgi:catechol 2,3-dioxygenase-like lactoylglutathione lyase family enzyme|nr:Methylmalonyl-CoA epimerase [Deltaproteobacteria bacterium]